LDDLDVLIALT